MFFKNKIHNVDDIIKGCIKNDRKCQQLLYEMFFDVMIKVCFRYTKDENDALSILHDGYLKAYQNIHLYKHIGSFEGWLRKIMYHSVIDHFRHKDRKLAFLQPVDVLPDVQTNENALNELILGEIYQLLDQLPDNSAKALKLFALEGYSHADIGKELNISEGTSRWHVANARHILKEKLKIYNQDHPKFMLQ
ncbi:MAG: RNA polymerase sigma factor [Saprospiraceae bacterium]|nr:RNA polymerase sigma factor [Saprospiraceae bacterium]MBK7525761.1 RNA polymerase sigma factor [Saprospiraceae bacterium]MBK8369917.1 RNA polymerase sigma factor [Saprospiraceae bacterium]MBK8855829.1 RNA polymerase sigma factor [Saprospiraceae bacterium]MBP6695203.1 RNA polymerase sigma factor [Saprospiraceae bacterium]